MAASAHQITANRANAQRSTGPRTPAGKLRSSRNACAQPSALQLAFHIPQSNPDEAYTFALAAASSESDSIARNVAFHYAWHMHYIRLLQRFEAIVLAHGQSLHPADHRAFTRWYLDNGAFFETLAQALRPAEKSADKLLTIAIRLRSRKQSGRIQAAAWVARHLQTPPEFRESQKSPETNPITGSESGTRYAEPLESQESKETNPIGKSLLDDIKPTGQQITGRQPSESLKTIETKPISNGTRLRGVHPVKPAGAGVAHPNGP